MSVLEGVQYKEGVKWPLLCETCNSADSVYFKESGRDLIVGISFMFSEVS